VHARARVSGPLTIVGITVSGLGGPVFWILPVRPPVKESSPVAQQVSEQTDADEARAAAGLRVLVVEDEALIRLDLTEMLTEEGYAIAGEAGDGEQAVALARELRPDLVIMDVKMPKMDGIEAAGSIVEEKIAPVVMLTAFSQRDLIEQARDAGAMAYLVKPFARHELVPAIELAVSRFAEKRALEDEVATLTDRLETRKVVDRAKGMLMTRQNMSEPEAFRWIQRTAMDRRTTMKAVAEAIVDGLDTPKS
jgi:two-component system, response regulator PdtaR